MIPINKQLKGSIILIICAFFWGTCFVAQDKAMSYVEPFTFVFMRSTITFFVLLAITPLIDRISGKSKTDDIPSLKAHIKIGVLLGSILVLASALQQIGIVYTTPAKSGFVTALYIVMVPVIGLFLGKRVHLPVWIGVVLSLVGLYLLCVKSDLSINIGDVITLGCALVFSVHILLIDRFGSNLNSFRLSTVQFGTCAVIAGIVAFIVEDPDPSAIMACFGSIVYAAVFSGAIGYTLQVAGQKYTDPTLASLLMCLESVFAVLTGALLLGEKMTARETGGCVLMFMAVILAQLSPVIARHRRGEPLHR